MPTEQYEGSKMIGMPVTKKYAQLEPSVFRESISETWQASRAILDVVSDQVEQELISTVQGAALAAAITGSLFGFSEFHRELRPADLALLVQNGK